MTERANQITASGLRDEKVIAELLSAENPDIEKQYKEFEKCHESSNRYVCCCQ